MNGKDMLFNKINEARVKHLYTRPNGMASLEM